MLTFYINELFTLKEQERISKKKLLINFLSSLHPCIVSNTTALSCSVHINRIWFTSCTTVSLDAEGEKGSPITPFIYKIQLSETPLIGGKSVRISLQGYIPWP